MLPPVARRHEVEQHQDEARDREQRGRRDGAQAHGGERERLCHLLTCAVGVAALAWTCVMSAWTLASVLLVNEAG